MTSLAHDERGHGPAVVLLPSGAHTRRDYDELRALIPERFRTIAIDWPAHGDSPAPPEPSTAMTFADAAEQAVADLAPEGAVLIGNSIGGFAAARLAIRRPELVRGLVLIDSGGFAGARSYERVFCGLMARPGFLRASYPAFSRRYMRSRTDADRAARERAIATVRRPEGAAAVAGIWRTFTSPEHDLREHAGSIRAPTLVIWGKRDPVLPLRIGRSIASSIAGAELAVFDAGHSPHTSRPREVAELLVPFLERVLDSEPARA